MEMKLQSVRRVVSVILLAALFAGCALGPNEISSEPQQRIETARTRADHQELTAYYNGEAASARGMPPASGPCRAGHRECCGACRHRPWG